MIITEQNLINLNEQVQVYRITETGAILGSGDMISATYDPTAVNDDAFDMENMAEGATNKIFTGAERTKLTGVEAGAEANNISDTDATDLTDGGETSLHSHVGSIDSTAIAINTATTLTIGKHHIISDLAVPADYTVTFPAAAGNEGKHIRVEMSATVTKHVTVGTKVMWANEGVEMRSDGAVWVVLNYKPVPAISKAKLSADFTVPAPSTSFNIPFDVLEFETTTMFGGNVFTVPRDGKYEINEIVHFTAGEDGKAMIAMVRIQAVDYVLGFSHASAPTNLTISGADTYELSKGDIIIPRAFTQVTATLVDIGATQTNMTVTEEAKW